MADGTATRGRHSFTLRPRKPEQKYKHPALLNAIKMPVGFGISVGDLISGLQLLRSSIEAVNDAKGSSADLQPFSANLMVLIPLSNPFQS
jgi:hypothetical protein